MCTNLSAWEIAAVIEVKNTFTIAMKKVAKIISRRISAHYVQTN
jgi:hypothetical protein